MFYKIAVFIIRVFVKIFVFRIKVHGKENIPSIGGAIVAINHRSKWDVPIAGIYAPRQFGFMTKAELFKNKAFVWIISKLGAFPVQRGKGDISAIKAALSRLRNNDVVAMFPEGKRVKANEAVSAKPGAVMLATRAGVPIVPIKIEGKYRWLSKISVIIGEPIYYADYSGEKMSVEQLQLLSDSLLKTIKQLEPCK